MRRESLLELTRPNLIFKRDDVRGVYPDQVNEEIMREIGRSFGRMLAGTYRDADPVRVVIGRDMRTGSEELEAALIAGLQDSGAATCALGLCSSEYVSYAAGQYPDAYEGGAMITASHNPPEFNGVKMVKKGGSPLSPTDLERLRLGVIAQMIGSPSAELDLSDEYTEHALEMVDFDPGAGGITAGERLRIVVNAANGMGGMVFKKVATRLSGMEFIFVDSTPDGSFPNHTPNPLNEDLQEALADQVRGYGADLGFCFDGDADRMGLVDDSAQHASASCIIALIASRMVEKYAAAEPQVHIMYNLTASWAVRDALERLAASGAPVAGVVTPVGHAKIKALMRLPEYKTAVFAGEHSGHFFFRDFYLCDSGVVAALTIIDIASKLKAQGKRLSDAFAPMRAGYFMSAETNFEFPEREAALERILHVWDHYRESGGRLVGIVRDKEKDLDRVQELDDYEPSRMAVEDLKLEFDNWWMCVRPSGTEPKLRATVEAVGDESLMQKKIAELSDLIGG